MEVNGPVEFWCWEEDESFESMHFHIYADDWEVNLVSVGCPYCEQDGHLVDEYDMRKQHE